MVDLQEQNASSVWSDETLNLLNFDEATAMSKISK